jgi:hypothetical protein
MRWTAWYWRATERKFVPLTIMQSGIDIPGNGKGSLNWKAPRGNYLLVAGQNKGPLKIFQLKVRRRQNACAWIG